MGKLILESALHSLGNIKHYLNDVKCVMDMNKAVFLDRDGVITNDPPHYTHRVELMYDINGELISESSAGITRDEYGSQW